MQLDPKTALTIAQEYIGTTLPLTRLGWGVNGIVYLSPDGRSAVKVHHEKEGFTRETEVYKRLWRLRISQLHGIVIPRLRGYRSDLKVIRMDFVIPPFLLDFAGARFTPPDFSAETMEMWHTQLADLFGPNVHFVYAVYHSLIRHGIYYMDFRPSNLKLDNLPGLELP